MVFQREWVYFCFFAAFPMTTKKGIPHDRQRSRLYHAERLCYGYRDLVPFKTYKHLTDYIDSVLNNYWVQWRWPHIKKYVTGERELFIRNGGRTNFPYMRRQKERDVINFPIRYRHPHVVLHYIAHLLLPENTEPHGREYCKTLITLTQYVMGKDTAIKLKKCMKQANCKYSKSHGPHQGPLTDEQKQNLLERIYRGTSKHQPQPPNPPVSTLPNEPTPPHNH